MIEETDEMTADEAADLVNVAASSMGVKALLRVLRVRAAKSNDAAIRNPVFGPDSGTSHVSYRLGFSGGLRSAQATIEASKVYLNELNKQNQRSAPSGTGG